MIPHWKESLVLIRGGGDIASGIAYRLFSAGFPVAILEIDRPTHIRRTVSFAQAVYDGAIEIEGVTGVRTEIPEDVRKIVSRGQVPVLIDPKAESLELLKPAVLVDAILAKKNLGTVKSSAPIVIGVGPGFDAGRDVHAVVETNRGHFLGRVIWDGGAQADTGIPGTVQGYSRERVLRAPVAGIICPKKAIGDTVEKGQVIAAVGEAEIEAGISGVVRGLINEGLTVTKGYKIGDIDPRNDPVYCSRISDKSLAVGGGVLEAVMHLLSIA